MAEADKALSFGEFQNYKCQQVVACESADEVGHGKAEDQPEGIERYRNIDRVHNACEHKERCQREHDGEGFEHEKAQNHEGCEPDVIGCIGKQLTEIVIDNKNDAADDEYGGDTHGHITAISDELIVLADGHTAVSFPYTNSVNTKSFATLSITKLLLFYLRGSLGSRGYLGGLLSRGYLSLGSAGYLGLRRSSRR